jgi:hypothetical protein
MSDTFHSPIGAKQDHSCPELLLHFLDCVTSGGRLVMAINKSSPAPEGVCSFSPLHLTVNRCRGLRTIFGLCE